jgi:hypothetical protein
MMANTMARGASIAIRIIMDTGTVQMLEYHREMRITTIVVVVGLAFALIIAIIPMQIAMAQQEEQHSFQYDRGFLQGISGTELKKTGTVYQAGAGTKLVKATYSPEFMSGYAKGLGAYWQNRGYVEGISKLPMSSHNANYTRAYEAGRDTNQSFGSLPVHTSDNYAGFYLGVYEGAGIADKIDDFNTSNSSPGDKEFLSSHITDCLPGHTAEYCAGFKFGLLQESYANDE